MFYVAILAFTVGIGVATVLTISLPVIVWIVLVGFLLLVVARRDGDFRSQSVIVLAALAMFMLAGGMLRTEVYKEQFETSQLEQFVGAETIFSGVVVREPDIRVRNTHLYIKSGEEIVLVTVDRHTPVEYGDELLIMGEVTTPETFETDLGREFNYPGYLEAKGVTHMVRYADTKVLSSDNGNSILATLLSAKHFLMSGIESVIPEPQAGLAEGLLLGVKQALGDQLEEAFRKSGIIHIVVLSGYNVMLVVAFFRFFMKPLPRFWQLGLGVLAVAGFALLVGLSATVVRASIMAGLVLLAGTLARSYDVMRALFSAGFVMLVINPYLLIYDIGFQLSFMATLGLLLVAPRLETALAEGTWFGAREFFLATVATQIAVLPLLLYHIGEISIVAVVVNVLLLPLVPFAMLGAFITGVVALASSSLALPLASITSVVLSYIITVAFWFGGLPFATFTSPNFSAYWILVMYGGMYLLYRSFSTNSNEVDLSEWEIVEEKEIGAGQRPAPSDDTPVFFR